MRFLLVCSHSGLDEFRIPEIESIATLFDFKIRYEVEPSSAPSSPFVVVHLPSEKEAHLLGSRSIAIKSIWEHWADAPTYQDLFDKLKTDDSLWRPHAESRTTTWKFTVTGHGRTVSQSTQRQVIETFSFMNFLGDIRLKNPEVEIGVFEEYIPGTSGEGESQGRNVEDMKRVWIGRKFCDTQRSMMDVFDVKKRSYIGNTTMESEVSLLMANQALAAPGKFFYDPFAGTGSMLLTSSAFGALTLGSDIDGRQMRGKNKKNIYTSAEQYGIRQRIVDCCSFDMTQHPFRTGELFDAIVTDPPYGVRAGAKRLGRKSTHRDVLPTIVPGREAEGFHHQFPDYVPPSVPWEMTEVIATLITYSLYLLKPGGRLVFFLPTNNEEYRDVDVPRVPGLRLISNSSQGFGKWARRLITMEKSRGEEWKDVIEGLDRGILREGMEDWFKNQQEEDEDESGEKRKPGHAAFSRRFFEKFVPVGVDHQEPLAEV